MKNLPRGARNAGKLSWPSPDDLGLQNLSILLSEIEAISCIPIANISKVFAGYSPWKLPQLKIRLKIP